MGFFRKTADDYIDQALVLYRKGSQNKLALYRDVMDLLDKAQQLKPDNFEILFLKGWLNVHFEYFRSAIRELTKALNLQPNNTDALYSRANAYVKLNQHKNALEDYNKAIELKPDFQEAIHDRQLLLDLMRVRHFESNSENSKQTPPEHLLAAQMYSVARRGIEQLKSLRQLTRNGEFEVLLFNSVLLLEYYYNKYPDRYAPVADQYWETIYVHGEESGLPFDYMGLREFVNRRITFYSDQLEAFRDSIVNGPGPLIPAKMYNVFYENPLSEIPVNSNDVLQFVPFQIGLTQMTKSVMSGTKSIS